MISQLLLCKRLFLEGAEFAERKDPVSSGIAISLFQDAAEMYVWTLIKERGLQVKEGAPFTSNLDLVAASNPISQRAKLLELNRARVGFKHYGNLPAPDEAAKFQTYVEDFLRTGFLEHFKQEFDQVSIVDLVADPEVREALKFAEAHITGGRFADAAMEAAKARTILFGKLKDFVPEFDGRQLRSASVFGPSAGSEITRAAGSLAEYLSVLREATLASFVRIPLQDFAFIRRTLPMASRTFSGNWNFVLNAAFSYDEAKCRHAVKCLVDVAIRLESFV